MTEQTALGDAFEDPEGTSLLSAALDYAAKGWLVFPLHSPTSEGCSCENRRCTNIGKHPRTAHGLKDATTNVEVIHRWWKDWPEANVGIATGPESGLFIVDVDGEDGFASLRKLESEGAIPGTLRVLTGRLGTNGQPTGRHLYFRYPAGTNLRNDAGKLLGKGLDIRATGGYVVAAPSLHASRRRYEFVTPLVPIADLPEWLIAKARKPAPHAGCQPESSIPEGQRNSALLSRAGVMRRGGMAASSILAALRVENDQLCHPPLEEEEVAQIAASVARYPAGNEAKRETRRANVLCLADVEPEEVNWLWPPYIPREMITLLSGDPGVGKTFLAMEIAASLTAGRAMLTGESIAKGNVLCLTNENSPAHVLRPRFNALGGDANRFFIVQGTLCADGTEGNISLADTELLEGTIGQRRIDLVIIDPLQSFLGGDVDAYRANQTRPILDGLIRLAERTRCAILITRHLAKGIGGSALYRGMGSIDFTGAARSELLVAQDPDQEVRKVMAHSKSNLGKFGPSLAFSIDETDKLLWHGESTRRADDLLGVPPASKKRSALDKAKDFLREVLASGPKPSESIKEQAMANEISLATLRRALDDLGVISKPLEFGGEFFMRLPQSCSS